MTVNQKLTKLAVDEYDQFGINHITCEFGWLLARMSHKIWCLGWQYPSLRRGKGSPQGHMRWLTWLDEKHPNRMLGAIKLDAYEVVYEYLYNLWSKAYSNEESVRQSDLRDMYLRLLRKAKIYMAVKPGKPFQLQPEVDQSIENLLEREQDLEFFQLNRPQGTMSLRTCQKLWARGRVYRDIAQDLAELFNRWQFPNWEKEFPLRIYNQHGELEHPPMGVRKRTAVKILKNRSEELPKFSGGFLEQ
jgi:hypothetical protein